MRGIRVGVAFLLAAVVGTGLGFWAASTYEVTKVTDDTMAPGYRKGAHVLVELAGEKDGAFARGDVVLFENKLYKETGEGDIMMKRIVGLPGEKIHIADGTVYIDGEPLEEPYISHRSMVEDMQQRQIPEDAYFVLGDNRGFSTDSRDETVGMIREHEILGKVIKKW